MFIIMILFSAFWFVMGIIHIFFKETAWKMTEWSNDMVGRESKRTYGWEVTSIISGICQIVFGFLCLAAAFTPLP